MHCVLFNPYSQAETVVKEDDQEAYTHAVSEFWNESGANYKPDSTDPNRHKLNLLVFKFKNV